MVTTKLNLSMTEPRARQIYAKQGDTGRVLDITLDQTPEDGTLRILRPDGVEVTSEAVTGGEISESGETVSFESLTEADVTELTAGIEPVQDLHGYDSPWPAGGGKNKLRVNSEATSSDFTADETTGVISIADISTVKWVSPYIGYTDVITGQTYTLSATGIKYGRLGGSTNTTYPNMQSGNIPDCTPSSGLMTSLITKNRKTNSFVSNFTGRICWFFCTDTDTASHEAFTIQPQLELGSTATSWTPYSNICPITGHDEVRVTRTGINVWNGASESGYIDVSTGDPRASDAQSRSLFVEVKPSTQYCYVNEHASSGVRIAFYDNEKIFCGNFANGNANPQTFTTPANAHYLRFYWGDISRVSINYPSADHDYHAYQGSTYTTSLGQTVYGGTLDVASGVLTVTHGNIASYNGETLPSTWISDRDVYASGTTPTTGAQVVYELATPLTYTLTAQQIKTLIGTNNVWASSGDIVSIKFTYGGLLSELPSDATSVVGKCYCDVEQNGVSSMPFTLNVKKNERES